MPLRRTLLHASIVGASLLVTIDSGAADFAATGEPLSVETHGFVSPGFILTTNNNYLARSKQGSFEFTEVGINFTVPLTDKLRAGIQLFTHDLGRVGNYNAKLDWFYLDYRFQDWFGLRAGRVKLPFGLYNDTSDIDAARVPVLLPQSVYPLSSRDFLLAQTGVEAYGRVDMRAAGALDYRFYAGTIYLDASNQSTLQVQLQEFSVPYVFGERVLWETPLDGLRMGASVQTLRLDASLIYNQRPINIEAPVVLWLGSLEYSANDSLLSAEYSRWFVRASSNDSSIVPTTSTVSERGYAMASYRVSKWFQPGVYYSLLYPNIHNRVGPGAWQHDVAATLRFDMNTHWLLKLEGHYMNGTAALDPTLNNNTPIAALDKEWAVFLVKTTAHF